MMKLSENPKFKEDYNRYKERILAIQDKSLQEELTKLLTQFSAAVAAVDLHHDTLERTGRMPEAVNESREKIASLKRQLDKRLILPK